MSRGESKLFKDSNSIWLGLVPAHWKIAPLKRLLDIQNGADQKEVLADEGYPIYGSGGIFGYATDFLYDGKSILLGRKGTIDKPLFVDGKFWTVDTMYWSKILPSASPRFAYYLATTIPFRYYSTNTALPSMTKADLGSHLVAYPDISEQLEISNYLDIETAKIDELIDKQEKLIELLFERQDSIISNSVLKGLDFKVKKKLSKVEWIGDIPIHWKLSKFCYETWVRARLGWKGLKAEEYVEDGYIFLATPNIKNSVIDFDQVNYISPERYDESPEIMLSVGDILLAKDGSTLGTVNLVRHLPRPATVNSSIAVITPKKDLDSEYLFFILRSSYMKNIIQMLKGGMGVPHLFQGDINKISIPIPPLLEQKDICNHINSKIVKISKLIEQSTRLIVLLRERRLSLIAAAVTGKVDLIGVGI